MVMELVERNLVKAVGAGGSTDGAVDPFAAGFRRVHQVGVSRREVFFAYPFWWIPSRMEGPFSKAA